MLPNAYEAALKDGGSHGSLVTGIDRSSGRFDLTKSKFGLAWETVQRLLGSPPSSR